MGDTEAYVQFVRRLAVATDELARSLDGPGDGSAAQQLDGIRPPLGKRQRQIVAMTRMASPDGMRAAEIARELTTAKGPNTYQVLETLIRRGLVERIPNTSPRRYRLAAQYRDLQAPQLPEGRRATATPAP